MGEPALDGGALGDRQGERLAALVHPLGQPGLLRPQLLGLPVELVGVAAGPLRLGVGREVPRALVGEPGDRAQPLGQRGEREPGLLRLGELGRLGRHRRVELGLLLAGLGQAGLEHGAAGEDRGLVGHLALELVAERQVVVGQQPQPRVAQVGLDGRGPAGDLGLPAERLEAAVELGRQVDQPGQVGLHRLELAERLLLALAVLEHARGLFDDRPPGLGARVQDLVELALADDDVHLAAETAVGEEVLDVEQAAGVAVDRVLALAGAEHQPADRHLGVVDRQRAVGVVDGERDLGPTQRRAGGGAGEDDVFHLAAAQRLRALLAHHPGERVDDVGLARAIRADDAGDAGLEAERGGGRERLEAAQGEGLQVHVPSPPPE